MFQKPQAAKNSGVINDTPTIALLLCAATIEGNTAKNPQNSNNALILSMRDHHGCTCFERLLGF